MVAIDIGMVRLEGFDDAAVEQALRLLPRCADGRYLVGSALDFVHALWSPFIEQKSSPRMSGRQFAADDLPVLVHDNIPSEPDRRENVLSWLKTAEDIDARRVMLGLPSSA